MSDRIRVMVVEDCDIDMSVITEALDAADIDYRAVSDSRDALDVAIDYQPAIAILDIHMPEMNGKEVREKLHTHPATSHIKVIFLSAKDNIHDVLYGLNVHVSAYFRKGVQIGQLINSINALDSTTKMRDSVNVFSAQSQRMANKYQAINETHH